MEPRFDPWRLLLGVVLYLKSRIFPHRKPRHAGASGGAVVFPRDQYPVVSGRVVETECEISSWFDYRVSGG